MYKIFIGLLIFQLKILQKLFKSKNNLILENIELRQQLAIYNHKKDKTKIITDLTRLFLVALKESWGKWKYALLVVKPETVIHWQKRRFKKYWTQKTNIHRKPPGRPKISLELRLLIKQMVIDNYNWGAQKIFSEILKLGYTETQLSPRTVSRYIKKIRSKDPRTLKKQQQWKTFLENHRHSILAMDFFTIPTVSFKILYVFFIIDHARRKIVHFNITEHPTSQWVKQQFREAIPCDTKKKYLIFDRDKIFSLEIRTFIKERKYSTQGD